MSRWKQGEAEIERMLENGELEGVPADPSAASALLSAARRHVASANAIIESDPEGAYALAYDGARKAATGLLAQQGLRPTSRGGHIVAVEAMRSQFPNVAGLRSLDLLRRRRNDAEYPDPAGYDPITQDELAEAVNLAQEALDAADRLVEVPQLGVF